MATTNEFGCFFVPLYGEDNYKGSMEAIDKALKIIIDDGDKQRSNFFSEAVRAAASLLLSRSSSIEGRVMQLPLCMVSNASMDPEENQSVEAGTREDAEDSLRVAVKQAFLDMEVKADFHEDDEEEEDCLSDVPFWIESDNMDVKILFVDDFDCDQGILKRAMRLDKEQSSSCFHAWKCYIEVPKGGKRLLPPHQKRRRMFY